MNTIIYGKHPGFVRKRILILNSVTNYRALRKIICFTAILTFLISMIPMSFVSASERKPMLSKKKITIRAGSSGKITLKNTKNNVKWAISGKKIISLKVRGNKKRTVIIKAGRRAGTCYIKAKAGKKTYKCKVIIKRTGDFVKKTISRQSQNMTGKLKKRKTKSRQPDSAFINATSGVSVRLLKEAAKGTKNDNILISPDSVLTAVSMLENGSDGDTRAEMEKVLGGISTGKYSQYLSTMHKGLTRSKTVKYRIANSIWYKKNKISVKKAYLRKLVDYFGAEVYCAPFHSGTVKDINAWVYNNTKGKISSILNHLSPSAKVALINAVYFKGAWAVPYQSSSKRSFTMETGKKQKVSMMEGSEYTYINVNGADGFIKPYQGGETAFLALLPPEGMSVDQYIEELKGEDIVNGYNKRMSSNVVVHTRIPEFGYEYEISLKKAFKNMGIRKIFSDHANMSVMTDSNVCADQILHKTYISLNKKGTEAAAVTAVVMKSGAIHPPEKITEKTVYLNRPFVYAIIDTKTGLPLFLGTVRKIS